MRDHPRTLRIGGMAVPAFHMFGLNVQALGPLYNVLCTGLFPPTVLGPGKLPIHPTHLNVLDHCRRTKCNALKTVPLFLQLWSQSTEDVLYLASLEHIVSIHHDDTRHPTNVLCLNTGHWRRAASTGHRGQARIGRSQASLPIWSDRIWSSCPALSPTGRRKGLGVARNQRYSQRPVGSTR